MEKKYCVYICKGCGIKEAMDVDKLSGAAKKVQNFKFHDVLCSPEGVQLIKDDMAKDGVNTIIIAACSPRVKVRRVRLFPERLLSGSTSVSSWPGPWSRTRTRQTMPPTITSPWASSRPRKATLPEPNILPDLSSTILVIGGGIAGMTAALSAAGAGQKVVLVEKDAQLGGFVNKLYKKIPTGSYINKPLIVDTDINKTVE